MLSRQQDKVLFLGGTLASATTSVMHTVVCAPSVVRGVSRRVDSLLMSSDWVHDCFQSGVRYSEDAYLPLYVLEAYRVVISSMTEARSHLKNLLRRLGGMC
ncbi:hypothetical protein DQ04_01761160 [Trypanosoma grayi]|uniref:hypothetical protein n=1 Tax=Trypanosoma grayi TaxID=71804 RepID=UPI0004F454D7|nr:hypothetical protein DQ04_01761160 [Trypanosoma grayi]KEG12381.1 hypothetical protein DQ04_01761160 [Trypanosoma grayi]